MPPWEIRIGGFEIPNPFFPGVLLPGHHVHAAVRRGRGSRRGSRRTTRSTTCSTGRATGRCAPRSASRCMAFYVVLFFAGGNDVIAAHFDLSVNSVTYVFRVLLFVLPVVVGLRHLPALQGARRRATAREPEQLAVLDAHAGGRLRRRGGGALAVAVIAPARRGGAPCGPRRIQQTSETASAPVPMSTSQAPNANPLAATARAQPDRERPDRLRGEHVDRARALGDASRRGSSSGRAGAPRESSRIAPPAITPITGAGRQHHRARVLVRREPVDDADHARRTR